MFRRLHHTCWVEADATVYAHARTITQGLGWPPTRERLARGAPVPDNAVVADAEHDPTVRSAETSAPTDGQASAPTEGDRDRFARLLTSALERQLLDEAEYLRRLEVLSKATSVEEMTQLVQQLPIFGSAPGSRPTAGRPDAQAGTRSGGVTQPETLVRGGGGAGGGGGVPGTGTGASAYWPGGLDPVDLARLAGSPGRSGRQGDHRWVAMVMVVLLFVLLLAIGVVLATRITAAPGGLVRPLAGRGGLVRPLAARG